MDADVSRYPEPIQLPMRVMKPSVPPRSAWVMAEPAGGEARIPALVKTRRRRKTDWNSRSLFDRSSCAGNAAGRKEDRRMAAKFLVKKNQGSDSALPVFISIALTKKTIQSIPCKKITGEGVFQMVDYQPIAELVKQIPADTWKILQEIQKRRPAMMLDELLDKRERAPKQPPNAQARKAS